MNSRIALLSDKFNELAELWGATYRVKAAVVLERGVLSFGKASGKAWVFKWTAEAAGTKLLTSASVEARLDAAHALTDLQRELERGVERRRADLEEAHSILDQLIGESR